MTAQDGARRRRRGAARRRRQPAWVTGPEARAPRGICCAPASDAILVGRGTVIDDDPLLTCRLPGLEARSPVRIVLARALAGLEKSRLGANARGSIRCGSFCPEDADACGAARGRRRDLSGAARSAANSGCPRSWKRSWRAASRACCVEGGPATWARVLARRADRRGGAVPRARCRRRRAVARGRRCRRSTATSTTDGFDIYDRRTIGGDDMLAVRRQWHRGGRRGHERSDATLARKQAMFTGIVSDIGEVTAREDGRFTIRARYPAQELEVGGSMACDGCCLTMTSVRADGERQPVHGRRLQRDARQDDARRVAAGPQDQPRALAAARRRAGRAPRHGPRRRPRPHRRHRAGRGKPPLLLRGARAPRALHRPERLGCLDGVSLTVNEVSDKRFGVNLIPAHLDGDDLGGENPRAIGQPRSRPVRALRRAAPGVPSVTHDVGKHAISEGRGCPVLDRRDPRGHAQRPHGRPRRRRGARERGRPRHPRADGDARRHQLHGQLRPRPDLPDADRRARRRAASSKRMVAPQRARATAPPSPQSIEAREGISTGISAARPRAHHRHRHRSDQGRRRHRLARPRLPAGRARGRRAGPRRPHRSVASILRGSPVSIRRRSSARS